MNLADGHTIFFHGISGAGMRGLAWLLSEQGKDIRGTDTNLAPDLPTAWRTAPEDTASSLFSGCDTYIYSDAVPANHPLRIEAETRGLIPSSFAQALGHFTAGYQTVAVAGTHGKSSTTAFLAHILLEAGKDPTVLIGASLPTWPGRHARLGTSNLCIVEADEYREHFVSLTPNHAIITNIEHDHPDYFSTLEDVTKVFQKFVNLLQSGGTLVIPESLDKGQLTMPIKTEIVPDSNLPSAPLPGTHMQHNAALAITMAERLGVPAKQAQVHLKTFPGLHRRFEHIGTVQSVPIISDYAHHPTEIAATLEAARAKYPGQRIGIFFEAHTADRLATFGAKFAQELAKADGVIVYPPFIPGGRGKISDLAFTNFVQALRSVQEQIDLLDTRANLGKMLLQASSKYDLIIACSAGILDQDLRKTVNKN